MAKVGKTPRKKRVFFDNLKLNKAIIEIRYPKGYLYWDVCGRCILEINKNSNEKIDFFQVSTDECTLKFLDHPNAKASFGIRHMTLSADELKNINIFKENGPLIFEVVKTNLKIQEVSRAGFRLFYALERESVDEAEEFIKELDICSVDVVRFKGFGNKVVVTQPIVEASDDEGDVRIRINAVKRTDADDQGAKFNEYSPRYAVLIDIDFFKQNIKIEEFDLGQFIHRSQKKIKEHIAQILNK